MPTHRVNTLAVVLVGATVLGWSVMGVGCGCGGGVVCEAQIADFSLDVVNTTRESMRVEIAMLNIFILAREGDHPSGRSGIVELKSMERVRLSMHTGFGGGGGPADNIHVRSFGAIYFYEAAAERPYKSYEYGFSGCGADAKGDCGEDDTQVLFPSSDGAMHRLFVPSPDRPFYLERDKENTDLGRLVITFVPRAE